MVEVANAPVTSGLVFDTIDIVIKRNDTLDGIFRHLKLSITDLATLRSLPEPGSDDLLLVWTPNYDARAPMNGHRHTVLACVSSDGGRSWPHTRRKVLVHDPARNTDYPAVFFHGRDAWIALRQSDDPVVIKGRMSTGLMRVPLAWFYS